MDDLAHWVCWGNDGARRHADRPELNSTPEHAMEGLLTKARLVFGEQDWAAWEWRADQFGAQARCRVRFRYEAGGFVRLE